MPKGLQIRSSNLEDASSMEVEALGRGTGLSSHPPSRSSAFFTHILCKHERTPKTDNSFRGESQPGGLNSPVRLSSSSLQLCRWRRDAAIYNGIAAYVSVYAYTRAHILVSACVAE